jgi:four helix bundle protein
LSEDWRAKVFIFDIVDFLMVRDFKRLDVWRLSIELSKGVYVVARGFPRDEVYGLTSQIKRAVVSVPSNIAEGCGKKTNKDCSSFLHHAMGSLKEVECQVVLARELDYLSEDEFKELNGKILVLSRKLFAFIDYIVGLDG